VPFPGREFDARDDEHLGRGASGEPGGNARDLVMIGDRDDLEAFVRCGADNGLGRRARSERAKNN
jgi:hypothetical protein